MISSNPIEIISYAMAADIHLFEKNNKLVVDAPIGTLTNTFQECLKKNKSQILKSLIYYGLTLADLEHHAGEDWDNLKNNQLGLMAFAKLLYDQKLMKEGAVPESFTGIAFCKSCDHEVNIPPEVTNSGTVLGCPWCHFRDAKF